MSYFFNPYMMGYNANRFKGVHRLDFGGIPFVRTSSVTTDTTNSEVIYGISPCLFRRLPNQGILLLSVNHVPAAGSDGYLVSVATTLTNTTSTSTSKVPQYFCIILTKSDENTATARRISTSSVWTEESDSVTQEFHCRCLLKYHILKHL